MRKTILVVDDDEDLLFCYRKLLENDKTIVYTASNVDEAIAVLQVVKIHLAILDYMLPKMTGAELAKIIGNSDPLVKIFFISGYDEALEAVKKLDVAVYGLFRKPVDPVLLEKLALSDDYSEFIHDSGNISAINLVSNI